MKTQREVRKENVRRLIAKRYDGVTNRLAVDLGVKHHIISRCLKPDTKRGIGDDLASRIEALHGLKQGELSNNQDSVITYANDLARKIDELPAPQRKAVEALIDALSVRWLL